jgi:hypothetical protein
MRVTAPARRLADLTFGTTASRIYLGVVATVAVVREVSDHLTAALDIWLTVLTSPVRLLLDPLEWLVTLDMTGTPVRVASYVTLLVAALVQAALVGGLARVVRRSARQAAQAAG